MKVPFLLRLKFAWYAFQMKNFEYQFPYQRHCSLNPSAGLCDNNRRKSNCNNKAKVALANPRLRIEIEEATWFYHVCEDCANKYINSMGGEQHKYFK